MRAAVVGAGIQGLATARALARRGHDVTVHEQFELDHTRGSSHGDSRIFRLSYPDVVWVRLAQEAYGGWRELERETGERLIELSGIIEIVRSEAEGSRRAFEEVGVAFELLDADEVARRYPVRVPHGMHALYQADAGITYASRARYAFLVSGRRHGVAVREHDRVENLDDLDADVVVVTAGSWAKDLLARADIDLPVIATCETVGYFRLENERPVPSVVDFKRRGRGHGTYALHDPTYGLKLGIHQSGAPVDPDDQPGPDPELTELMSEAVARYFPTADARPANVETCLYTNTDDERFILERHGRIVVGSACSGHGFKFAPVVGERLAELAEAKV
ncbi:MAG TPA: FAD-dependent oxidoreductase [Gaiellaceae bacterium]|nr:FAD-dependent oxidoreductase [Gaiellaceae bacterium]